MGHAEVLLAKLPLSDPQEQCDPRMLVERVLTSEVPQQLSQERQTFNLGNLLHVVPERSRWGN